MRACLVLALAACAPPVASPVARPVSGHAPVEPPEPTPHADYAELRAFRNYYRIVKVGDFRQHWRAWFFDRERVRVFLTAAPDGTDVEWQGDDFGGDEADHSDDYPAAQASVAAAVRARVRSKEKRATVDAVAYDGTYREVWVEELVPLDDPGPPTHRHVITRAAVLRADDALTSVGSFAAGEQSGTNTDTLCRMWSRDCGPAPYWVDFRPDRESRPWLWQLTDPTSDVEPDIRAAFDRAVAIAAAQLLAGQPPPGLDELATQRDPDVLPADADDSVALTFYITLRERPGGGYGSVSSWFTVKLSLGSALAGHARGARSLVFAGREIAIAGELVADAPAGARGRLDLPATLEYWVRDGLHDDPFQPVHHGRWDVTIPVWIEDHVVIPVGAIRGDATWRESIPYRVLDADHIELTLQLSRTDD